MHDNDAIKQQQQQRIKTTTMTEAVKQIIYFCNAQIQPLG